MEVKRKTYWKKTVAACVYVLLCFSFGSSAQIAINTYTVKNGRMYIALTRPADDTALDRFIAQYNLEDLPLKQAVKKNMMDSMKKLGWKEEISNSEILVVSKALFGVNNINNPADKIIFTGRPPATSELFPVQREGLYYGYNRFRNKFPFAVKGNAVTFYLRNNTQARRVMLAGSFNDWKPDALAMTKTDSGWIANVNLLAPGKYWYKFIIDGNWNTDNDNLLNENDGKGNVNSVFYKTNYVLKLDGYSNKHRVYVSGSFNRWRPAELLMVKTANGWELPMYLAKGTHTYKFVADGEWITDPKNEKRIPDGINGFNSVIENGSPYLFKLDGYTNAKSVILVGTFNDWRQFELSMKKTNNGWELPYVLGAGNYEYKFIVDGKFITDPSNPLTTNPAKNIANSFLVIEPNFTFRLKDFSNARQVFLAGDFNNWSPYSLPMKHEGDEWTFRVHLSPGKHLYKFVVDGKWTKDPGNKLWEQNEFGTGNSIVWMGN